MDTDAGVGGCVERCIRVQIEAERYQTQLRCQQRCWGSPWPHCAFPPTASPSSCSTTGMLFYNSVLSLPMLLAAVVMKGEPLAMVGYPLLFNPQFQLVLLLASALGLTINHSTFVCTRVNEPLMTSVAGGRGLLAAAI